MRQFQQTLTAILLANYNQTGEDTGLLKMYGETLAEITFYRLRDVFSKIFIIVNDFNQKSDYEKLFTEDIIVSTFGKGMLSKTLAGLKSCKSKYIFLTSTDMPLIDKRAMNLIVKNLEIQDYDAVVPRHPSGKIEPLHALYKASPVAAAIQKNLNDENFRFENVLTSLENVKYIPIEKFQELDPKLTSFLRVQSELDFGKVKGLMKQKVFKARLDKAEKLEGEIKVEGDTQGSTYFKVPGTDEAHEVRFDKRKNSWVCDCKYFTMKGAFCSHILAAQKYLKQPH